MDLDRINPVALITGATTGAGSACARAIASRADGGLILVGDDAAALDALADKLGQQGAAPERVSMLAFDVADPDAWKRAHDFIKGQYGRLDWAIVNADATAPEVQSDLVQWPQALAHLEGAVLTLRSVMPLMKLNSQGGAIVVAAAGHALKPDAGSAPFSGKPGLLQMVRAASKEGAPDIRVNAVAADSADAAVKASAPAFADLVRETGSERLALERITILGTPLVRYGDNISSAIIMLLSDDAPITGATLVVDSAYTL